MNDTPRLESPAAEPPARRRRVWRVFLAIVGGAIATMIVAMMVLLGTNLGSQWLVYTGVASYNGLIAGSIEIELVNGSVLGQLEIDGLQATNAHGDALLHIGTAAVKPRLVAGFLGDAWLFNIVLHGVHVVVPDDDAGFDDLLPPPGPNPQPPDTNPALPSLDFEFDVQDFRLDRRLGADGPLQRQVNLHELALRGRTTARNATLQLTLAADIPAAHDLSITQLELVARRDGTRVTVDALTVASHQGHIAAAPTTIDLETGAVTVGPIDVRAKGAWLGPQIGLKLVDDLTLSLTGEGSQAQADIELDANVPGWAEVSLQLSGSMDPSISGQLRVHTTTVASPTDPRVPGSRQFDLRLDGTASPAFAGAFDVHGEVSCRDCDPAGAPVRVQLEATGDRRAKTGEAQLVANVAGSELRASAILDERSTVTTRFDAEFPSLATVSTVMRAFVDIPQVAGALDMHGECHSNLDAADGDCTLSTRLERGHPVEHLDLDVSTHFDASSITVDLQKLVTRATGLEARLRRPPARATFNFASQRVDVEDLDLAVATSTGEMQLLTNGHVDPSRDSDLDVQLTNADLRATRAFVPELGLRGLASGRLQIQGPSSAPRIDATLDVRKLGYRDAPLGRLEVAGRFADRHLDASLRARGGIADSLHVELETPLVLDLEHGQARLGSGTWRGAVHLDETKLALLRKLDPSLPAMAGSIALDIGLAGTTERPQADIEVRGRELSFANHELESFTLVAQLGKAEHATATLTAHHQAAALIEMHASVPLRWAMRDGVPEVDWDAQTDQRIVVKARQIDLATALALAGSEQESVPIVGRADVDLDVYGSLEQPRASTRVKVHRLAWAEQVIGRGSVTIHYDAGLSVHARATGPAFHTLEVDASAPITLQVPSGVTSWNVDAPHDAELHVDGLALARLAEAVPELAAIDGRSSLRLTLAGSASEPVLTGSVRLTQLQAADVELGDVDVEAGYQADELRATATLRHEKRHGELSVQIPVSVDLSERDAAWLPEGLHDVHVRMDGLNAELAAQLVDLPPAMGFDVGVRVDGKGNRDDFSLKGGIVGDVHSGPSKQQLAANVLLGPKHQVAKLSLGQPGASTLTLSIDADVDTAKALSESIDPQVVPLRANLRANDFDLALLEPMLPPQLHALEGTFTAHVDMEGTLTQPRYSGNALLANGGVTIVPMRQRYDEMGLALTFSNHGATLDHASARSGEGSVSLSGSVEQRADELAGKIVATATDLPFEQPGMPRLRMDSVVTTTFKRTGTTSNLDVAVTDTTVDVLSTNVSAPQAIPTLANVTFADEPPPTQNQLEAPRLAIARTKKGSTGERMQLDVRLADPVRVRGPVVDMAWNGSLHAAADDAGVEASGALACERGTFDLLGNSFTIQSGEVTIPPSEEMELFVDVVATTSIEDYDIKATIKGNVARPVLTLSSEPEAPESEIFKMLVTGTANPESADPDQVQAQAAALLAALSSPALQREVNESLGVDKIGLTFGDSVEDPILSVGKHVSKTVYVETRYHHGATEAEGENRAELGVRYRFSPRWFLETYFGTAQAGGVDLFWGRAYDIRRHRWWIGEEPEPTNSKQAEGRP